MAAVDIESVIKKGVEEALNKPILNGKSVMQWAEIGIHSQEQPAKDTNVPSKPEIVRCKDCKHRTLLQNVHGEWMVECENPDAPWLERLITAPDWFCADGEVIEWK